MNRLRTVLLSAALFAAVALPSIAGAAAAAPKKEKYIELEALIVEGQIQRPQAVYIIKRAGLDFGAQAKRKSFIDKVKKSIEEEPF